MNNDITFDSSVESIRDHISDRYENLRLIGAGGMGAVYRAFDKKLNRQVAVKVILSGVAAVREVQARFEREVLALAKIKHPNIVQLFDFESTRTRAYFTMEFIRGLSLRELIAQRRIAVPAAVRAFIGLCDALDTVHRAGLVHRDIKPANIIINRQGKAILMDFGLAKFLDNDTLTQLTRTDQVFGTLRYLPPEALLVASSDPRSDVYQLGIMLQEAVTQKHPVNSSGMTAIIKQIRDGSLPKPKGKGVDDELARIIIKARATDPSLRYQSAGSMRDDLQEWLGEVPPEESEIEIPPELLRSMTGHTKVSKGTRTKLILYILAVLIPLVAAASLHWFKRRGRKRRRPVATALPTNIPNKTKITDDTERDVLGWTAVHHAAHSGQVQLLDMLIAKGEKVVLPDDDGWLPLHVAAAKGHSDTIRRLLKAGSSINCQGLDGRTPLMWAAAEAKIDAVSLLLDKGAAIEIEDRFGRRALHWAAEGGAVEIVRKLIGRRALVNALDSARHSPLHVAANEGHERVIAYLIGKGAEVDIVDYRGSTPVYLAAARGQKKAVEVLAAKSVDINRYNRQGLSPLLSAVASSDAEMVSLLLENGADAKKASPFGVTPMELAEKQAIDKIIKLLGKH